MEEMFSGKKFRLWSRQSSSKKDADKESPKNRGKHIVPKIENEVQKQSTAFLDNTKSHLEKLQEDYSRLEEAVKELTPYKTQVGSIEKKLISATKSFERKEVRYTAAIASLESENEHLREEIKRSRNLCSGCYFCSNSSSSRHLQFTGGPLPAKPSRNEKNSNESLQSDESRRRLERLEEEQSAIVQETSRQRQETSRCMEQISNEVVKTILSQKALRRDCSQLQDRIQRLEKQNSQLNKVVFRQYTPSSSSSSSSHTRHPTVKRNGVYAFHPEAVQTSLWDAPSPHSISSFENLHSEENMPSRKPFRAPTDRDRFGKAVQRRSTADYRAHNHIPQSVHVPTTDHPNCQQNALPLSKSFANQISPAESKLRNPKYRLSDFFVDHEDKAPNVQNWETSTSSTLTLRDETEEVQNETTTDQRKTSFSRGSTFSLNDILDGDIDELQLSIQSLETTRNNSLRRDVRSSVTSSEEKLKEPFQAHFSCTNSIQSITSSIGLEAVKHDTNAEIQKRYSCPSAVSFKNGRTWEKEQTFGIHEKTTDTNTSQSAEATETKRRKQKHFSLCALESDSDDKEKEETTKTKAFSYSEPQMPDKDDTDSSEINEDTAINKETKTFSYSELQMPVKGDTGSSEINDNTAIIKERKAYSYSEAQMPDKGDNGSSKIGSSEINDDTTINKETKAFSYSEPQVPYKGNIGTSEINDNTVTNKEATDVQNLGYVSIGPHTSLLQQSPLKSNSPEKDLLENNDTSQTILLPKNTETLEQHSSHKNMLSPQVRTGNSCSLQSLQTQYHDDITDAMKRMEDLTEEHQSKQEQEHKAAALERSEFITDSNKGAEKAEGNIHRKRERFYSLPNESFTKDVGTEVNVSKDKVTALTAFFEEVHAEQCPGCQHNATRRRASCTYPSSFDSKDEYDSGRRDVIIGDINHVHTMRCQGNIPEKLKAVKHESEAIETDIDNNAASVSEISTQDEKPECEAILQSTATDKDAVNDCTSMENSLHEDLTQKRPLQYDTTISKTPETATLMSEDLHRSEDATADSTRAINLKQVTNDEIFLQTEKDFLEDSTKLMMNSELQSSQKAPLDAGSNESNKLIGQIRKAECKKRKELASSFSSKDLAPAAKERLVDKRLQWKSMPSSLSSTADCSPPLLVSYIRAHSLKSFWDVITPPQSPKLHKHPNDKDLNRSTEMNSQAYARIQNDDQFKGQALEEAQNITKAYPQSHPHHQVLVEDKSPVKLKDSVTSKHHVPPHFSCLGYVNSQGPLEDLIQDEDWISAPSYQEPEYVNTQGLDLIRDEDWISAPSYQEPMPSSQNIRNILHQGRQTANNEMTALDEERSSANQQYQPKKGHHHLPGEYKPDDILDDSFRSWFPALYSVTTRPEMTKSYDDTEKKRNTLTKEDIRKYQLSSNDIWKNTRDERRFQSDKPDNVISLITKENLGNTSLRTLSTKPPLPPRRVHVTKYYVQDASYPNLEPPDYEDLEDEIMHIYPGSYSNELISCPYENVTDAAKSKEVEKEISHLQERTRKQNPFPDGKLKMEEPPHPTPKTRLLPFTEDKQLFDFGKCNSYPDGSNRSYSQEHEEDAARHLNTTWHHQHDFPGSGRPSFSSYQMLKTESHSKEAFPEKNSQQSHCKLSRNKERETNPKDTENDSAFNEISKQIENLRQTVNEMHRKTADS